MFIRLSGPQYSIFTMQCNSAEKNIFYIHFSKYVCFPDHHFVKSSSKIDQLGGGLVEIKNELQTTR
jgi:hypothetical protein